MNAAIRQAALTLTETAERLAVAESTVRALIHRGELSAIRVGRLLRISPDALAAYLASNAVKPVPTPVTTSTPSRDWRRQWSGGSKQSARGNGRVRTPAASSSRVSTSMELTHEAIEKQAARQG